MKRPGDLPNFADARAMEFFNASAALVSALFDLLEQRDELAAQARDLRRQGVSDVLEVVPLSALAEWAEVAHHGGLSDAGWNFSTLVVLEAARRKERAH